MTTPELIWLDQGFQPWRVWRLRMDGLTSYTRTDTIPSDPRVKALVEALQVTAGVLRSERTRSGGQPFTGVWSMPSIGRRVTVSEALDEADAALAALKGAANE